VDNLYAILIYRLFGVVFHNGNGGQSFEKENRFHGYYH
jgi:hypothetical protein